MERMKTTLIVYVCPECGSTALEAVGQNAEWCFGFGTHEARREPVEYERVPQPDSGEDDAAAALADSPAAPSPDQNADDDLWPHIEAMRKASRPATSGGENG